MRHLGFRGRGRVAIPLQVWTQLGMTSTLAVGHNIIYILIKKSWGLFTNSDLEFSSFVFHEETIFKYKEQPKLTTITTNST